MRIALTTIAFLLIQFLNAQKDAQKESQYIKFGKINVAELEKKTYSIDSGANAVVISDIGEAQIEGNNKGWFSISFKQHRVVHILNKNGYDEADVVIPLYTNGNDEERVDDIKAVTYNLENGKIIESKLEKSGIFKEKIDNHWIHKKFTLPNVKEGCIIEYQYTVTSDFIFNLEPWKFQGSSPVMWSEYNLSVPQFFTYAFLSHGYQPFYLSEHKDRQSNFTVLDSKSATSTDRFNFTSGVTDYRWVMKDVPELKKESFTSTIKNHIARLEFQLSSQSDPLQPHDYRNTWTGLTKELMESEYFGKGLNNGNGWMSDDVKPLIAGASSDLEKAKKIYGYVRDNFTCTDHSRLSTEQSLKNIFKSKKGTVSEINLLLTAMLRYAGLFADPVILSTRDHGYILPYYPLITSFNYVVSKLTLGEKDFYLDASYARLGFGKLTSDCYNGHARIVNEEATPLVFSADSVLERKVTSLIVINDDKGKWVGTINQTNGDYESYDIRNKVKENGKEEFFKEIQKEYGQDAKISSPVIDSLTSYEEPVALHYDIDLNPNKEDIIYLNPMFGERYKKNPFASAQRLYPVEMPSKSDETFVLNMEIPKGYEVDELPKQMRAKLDEQGSATFEYVIAQSGSSISMRSRIKFNRTLFLPEEYDLLREFFNMVVKKQNEQIVFKKKK